MTKPQKEAERWFDQGKERWGLVEGVPYEVFDAEAAEQALKDLEMKRILVKTVLVFP